MINKMIDLKKWNTIDIGHLVCEALKILEERGLFGEDKDDRKTGFACRNGMYTVCKVKNGFDEKLELEIDERM